MKIIKSIKEWYEKVVNFFTSDLWMLDKSNVGKVKYRFLRQIKVVYITIRDFGKQNMGIHAVSLSFFTTMAFIPFVAVVFSLTNGFGLGSYLKNLLYQNFTNQELIDTILGFAENIINTSQKGPYGFLSFLAFVWLVIWLMLCVERAFNKIWKVEKARELWKRFTAYIAILLLSPFVIILFLSMAVAISSGIKSLGLDIEFFDTSKVLVWFSFLVVATLIITCLFVFIPNAKVKFLPAFKGAVLTALAFTLVQYLYLETQIFFSRLNGVYGVFAAVPLFMIWVNIGWFVILIGSNISYALQNVDSYHLQNKLINIQ